MNNEIRIPKSLQKRIIKRHGFATSFYALLMLLCASVPIVSLFFPNLGIIYPGESQYVTMDGIDVLKGLFFQSNLLAEFLDTYPQVFGSFSIFAWIAIFALALLLCWPLIVAFIQICKGFKLIFYGQSRHMARPICTSLFSLISYIVFLAACIVCSYFLIDFSKKASLDIAMGLNWVQFIFLGIELLIFILMIIIYATCFSNKAYIYEIDLDSYEEDIILEDLKPIEAKGIDVNGPVILDHQYSKTNIFYAHIPIGVTSIGNGAFSNCVHLRQLFIPRSVKKIGANAFFNCQSLEKIVYNGTKLEWSRVVRGSNWLLKAGTNIVLCKDGAVQVSIVD